LHTGVELVDRLAAGVNKDKGQQGMQHAGEARHHHASTEPPRAHQVLPVGLAYGFGVIKMENSITIEGR